MLRSSIPTAIRATAQWEGFPFSASDLEKLAQDSKVGIASSDFAAAAISINNGLALFVLASQTVSPEGDFQKWFKKIADQSSDLLSLFGDLDDRHNFDRARRSFFHHPKANADAGFLYDDFEACLKLVSKLRKVAVQASQFPAQRVGKRGGRPRVALKAGVLEGWLHLTGARTGGITKPQDNSAPHGPFIYFCELLFTQAANRLGASGYQPNAAVVDELRQIAGNPHSIAELQRGAAPRAKVRKSP